MPNRFSSFTDTASMPAVGSFAVTPSNGADLTEQIRAITISGAGTVSWVGADGATYNTASLPPGTYEIAAVRIRATGTTATGITGWV